MSFDFSTLITDRTQADVSSLSALMEKKLETWTDEEREKFNNGLLKGGYWWTDLNRVTACMEYLDEELRKLGYESGYKPVLIERPDVPGPSRLPEGYTELEYIKSNGSQYINTNIPVSNETEIFIDFLQLEGTTGCICGCDKNWLDSGIIIVNNIASFGYTSSAGDLKLNDGIRHTITVKNGVFEKDGVAIFSGSGEFSSDVAFSIFGLNRNGTMQELSQCEVYEAIVSTGSRKGHFIPCKSESGGVGMYDLESNAFFGNSSGTGSFFAGPDVEIPLQPNPLDPYTWYESDVPTISQMAQYLANVAAIRSVFTLPDYAPQTPESMALLTFAKANDIESVLQYVETTIQQTVKGMARSNSFTFWSGNRAFPTAESNKGRNWGELDEMKTGWRNWQLATWYLLLYGNLKAEGDVV